VQRLYQIAGKRLAAISQLVKRADEGVQPRALASLYRFNLINTEDNALLHQHSPVKDLNLGEF
jgi:hypothetical protein